jgi:hypothetical protein
MDKIQLAWNEVQWWSVENIVMNLRVPYKLGNVLSSLATISYSIRTLLHNGISYNM